LLKILVPVVTFDEKYYTLRRVIRGVLIHRPTLRGSALFRIPILSLRVIDS
jgi:hypothetical protein